MALESTVTLQQNDGNKTPEKAVDREKVRSPCFKGIRTYSWTSPAFKCNCHWNSRLVLQPLGSWSLGLGLRVDFCHIVCRQQKRYRVGHLKRS